MTAILDHTGRAMSRVGRDTPTPYEAGGRGRRLRGWMAPGSGPNDAATGSSQTLRNRSRQQYRNNGYGLSGTNKLVSNIIGTGIKPRSMAESKDFQRRAQTLWSDWGKESDPEGVLGIYGQQAQAVNAWLQGGECFIRRRPRRETDGLTVPMQVQVMEAEMCPVHYNGWNGRNAIRAGIEYDRIGRRAAYWFYQSHPGDLSMALNVNAGQLTRVPARDVIHLFDPIRPGQSRGVIKMAPILLRMYDVDKYDDATLLRQQIANLFAAFVTNPQGERAAPLPNSLDADHAPTDDSNDPLEDLGMEAGMIQELLEGQDIRFAAPPDAGSTYGDFLRQQLQAEAAGIEVPYELLTGDFSKINDRTGRIILNQFYRRVQQMQHHIVIHQMCLRIWAHWWMPTAVQSGALDAPDFGANMSDYTRAKHIPQSWAYINPVQDVQADREAVRAGIKTRGDIVNERTGEDVDEVDARWAAEAATADDLGLRFDSDPRWTDNSGKRLDGAQVDADEQAEAESG